MLPSGPAIRLSHWGSEYSTASTKTFYPSKGSSFGLITVATFAAVSCLVLDCKTFRLDNLGAYHSSKLFILHWNFLVKMNVHESVYLTSYICAYIWNLSFGVEFEIIFFVFFAFFGILQLKSSGMWPPPHPRLPQASAWRRWAMETGTAMRPPPDGAHAVW